VSTLEVEGNGPAADSRANLRRGSAAPPQPGDQAEPVSHVSSSSAVRYCIITPVRDEAEFIGAAIEAVVAQTIRPVEWIIVDDGSTDETTAIVERYARKYPWIRLARREDRGFRSTGGGIEGFLLGIELLRTRDWEFLVNLDGDLTFSRQYFEKCFEYFRKNPRLGIGGGTIYNRVGNRLFLEKCPDFHVRGATKIYRRQCWDMLGGMLAGLGWDTVDEIKAHMRGWSTFTFPDLQLIHHRVTGSAQGDWGNGVKNGHSDYIVGYHPLFFAVKCLRRMFRPPYVLGAMALAYGFLGGYLRRAPRVKDGEFIRYIRRQQLRRLFGSFTGPKLSGIDE
jgi:poly-beta-1,6-N-acetyl-D-glucosamine synthase